MSATAIQHAHNADEGFYSGTMRRCHAMIDKAYNRAMREQASMEKFHREQAAMKKKQPVRVSQYTPPERTEGYRLNARAEERVTKRCEELVSVLKHDPGEWYARTRLRQVTGFTDGQLDPNSINKRLVKMGVECERHHRGGKIFIWRYRLPRGEAGK